MDEYEIGKIKEESCTLDSRLERITLSSEEINEITKNKTMNTLKDKGANLFGPIGKIAITIMGWHEEMEGEFKKVKERQLLEGYFNKTDEQLDVINKLKNFVTDPYGFTIFSKIRAILNDTPPDSELIEHLSTVLANIVTAEHYEVLFEKTKYILNQIEKLSPQSLTILADKSVWPTFELSVSTYSGGKISSDFHKEFGKAYTDKKGIIDENITERVIHSIRELQNANLLEGYKLEEDNQNLLNECRLTKIGKEIAEYLK